MTVNKILPLENSLINKIAAGEVVERPLSVVKEIIENSVDAGASNIAIEILNGGIDMIRITDNGSGIPADEVETAFTRHATSKISELADLENISTLGFRGEALSSIASVSQVEVFTRTERDIMGRRIEIHGGHTVTNQDVGTVAGTTIIIRNLFYNVPARFKFLKKPAVEGGYISDLVNKLALGNPKISFKFINNKSISLQTSGNGDLLTVIAQIYGKEVSSKMLKLFLNGDSTGTPELSGYIGKPETARATRSFGNIFVNGRYVKCSLVQQAMEEAYKTKLPIGKFPAYTLNITINPFLVDVNVHPAKTEVRFSREDKIFECVKEAVTASLRDNSLIPEAKLPKVKNFAELINKSGNFREPEYKSYEADVIELKEKMPSDFIKSIYESHPQEVMERKEEGSRSALTVKENNNDLPDYLSETEELENPRDENKENNIKPKPESLESKPFFVNYRIVGQVFNTYWIIEQSKSIFMLDQHAAHERILYEEIMKQFDAGEVYAQTLLQPMSVHLSKNEKITALNNIEIIQNMGFDFEEFGENTAVIRSVPYIMGNPAAPSFFLEMLDKLSGFDKAVSGAFGTKAELIAGISCKAAVKANDKLSLDEVKALIDRILSIENPFTCPHGRPTIIELTQYELEKRFKRV